MKLWCSVVTNYLHRGDSLTVGETRYMDSEDANFLAANGVVKLSGTVPVEIKPQTVELTPSNSVIGMTVL